MDNNQCNSSIRQAISNKYVECSKRKREIIAQILELRSRLSDFMNGLTTLSYTEYIDIKSSLDRLQHEDETLEIQIAVWNDAREICLNIMYGTYDE